MMKNQERGAGINNHVGFSNFVVTSAT